VQVGDLVRMMGEVYIISNICGVYADLINSATLQEGGYAAIDDNPYLELLSSRDHSSKKK